MKLPVLSLLLVTGSLAAGSREENFKQDFQAMVDFAMTTCEVVPGLSIAFVKGDQVLVASGYGYLDRERKIAAEADSKFYIASSTKSFAALTALVLDHQGALSLQRSLADSLPEADWPTSVGADRITLADLLSHSAGLNNDAIVNRFAYTGEHDQQTLLRLVGYTEPNRDAPPGQFDYTNLGYNLLGMLWRQRLGKNWKSLVAEHIIRPLGMQDTTAYFDEADPSSFARPYYELWGSARLHLEKRDETLHAAGGLYASARDMAKWLRVQMNEGRLGPKQVFPSDLIRRSHEALVDVDRSFGPYRRTHYGLGWYLATYENERMIHHFGSYPGTRSHVSFLPEHKLGIAVMTNEGSIGFRLVDLLANYAYDWWLKPGVGDGKHREKIQQLADGFAKAKVKRAQDRAKRAERKWNLSQPRQAYAGHYRDERLGSLRVMVANPGFTVRAGRLQAVAEPYDQQDKMRLELLPGRGSILSFDIDASGEVNGLTFQGQKFQRVKK